ncbi:cobalt transporter [Streptomyces sp. CNQ-509]|uniref:CbtB-domain containing protein n=1 Tax=unclassified Streptomyces TaxID=2593676 RepID=UPI00062DFCCE|nr:CbtB-domain containing protein [Streptomyces sp. CNQ-509]AKH81716.1 cobalt transporter [Streptomyces sp. CNQ-509]
MAQSAVSPTTDSLLTPVPLRTIAPRALFGGILMLVLVFAAGAGQGAVSLVPGEGVQEWLHDARHLLGFPSR